MPRPRRHWRHRRLSSKRKLQPIAPSADWRVDLAEGCPAHCNYCYLAGSLKGPPITRVYANLPEILAELPPHVGRGTVTSRSRHRAHEGHHVRGVLLHRSARHRASDRLALRAGRAFRTWQADVQLRFTSKFDAVEPLLGLDHAGRTRMRFSLNPPLFARFEGGTSPVAARLRAMRRMAEAGYKVGLTIAPIIAAEGWEQAYGALIADVAAALEARLIRTSPWS
jgi:spore photoproduct lyase